MMNTNIQYFFSNQIKMLVVFLFFGYMACTPERIDEHALTEGSSALNFTIEPVPGNSNKFLLRTDSDKSFQRLWDLPGGIPKTSVKSVDTVFYNKAGTYQITLFSSLSDGSGTLYAKKTVVVEQDAPLSCSSKLALLTGSCQPDGKCWTFSKEAGAVKVGPTYDDYSWFTSTAGGLQDAQYDDGFCFTFKDLVFQNKNNGATVNPWDGYKVQPYDPGVSDFNFLEGTGINGRDQIVLQDDQFIGVWDADNVLDIVKLTADQLVVRTRIRAQNGVPNPEGWFELTLVAK